ncbi:MAG: PAS domain S-box protein [Pseudomonadota bacterium]
MAAKPTYEELEQQVKALRQSLSEPGQTVGSCLKNENSFRLMFMNAPLPYQSLDETGAFIDVNQAFLDVLGYTREELIGKNFGDFLHPDWTAHFKENFPRFKAIGEILGVEFEMVKKNGDALLISLDGKIQRDDSGNFKRTHCIFHDITEQRRMEEALRKSEENYRFLVEHSNDIIWVFDLSTMAYSFCSQSIETILGYTAEQACGKSLDTVFTRETKKKIQDAFGKIATGRSDTDRVLIEAEHRHKDGRLIWMEINAVLQKDSAGQPVSFSGVSRDITARKQIEKEKQELHAQLLQSQKMESIGRLAGGVAHDFNNMLMVIIGNAEMTLEEIDLSTPAYAQLQEIYTSAQRSAELTRHLLAFAQKQTISPKILDLNKTISGMAGTLQRLIGEDIQLIWKPGIDLLSLKMDPSQIDQIMVNLAVNARDAIAGVGTLTIETRNIVLDEVCCMPHEERIPGEYVMLSISDTGCGMEKKILGHLFEPFFTTKELGKGTGLGLATIYGIVKQNKGYIDVDSDLGRGTTFKICFPGIPAENRTESRDIREKPASGTETVLLVEDEPSILKLGKAILERYGYTVLAAQTPAEALDLAGRHHDTIQLLITDVVMPQMHGRDLQQKIAAFCPAIKTIFMSGYTANIITHDSALKQDVHFLQKPFSVQTLAAKTREVLDDSGATG